MRRVVSTCGLALIALILFTPKVAFAQGLPMLPDPITTEELMDYAETLDLPPQQRLGLEPFHDEYLQRFAVFRERDVQKFQDDILTIGMRFASGQFQIPEREEVMNLVSQFENIVERMELIDGGLFSQIETMLTDDQVVRMQRVRTARKLRIYRHIAAEFSGEFNQGSHQYLSELVNPLDLSAEERAHADRILTTYETTLLDKTRNLHRILKDSLNAALDTVDRFDIRNMSMEEMMAFGQDPENIETLRGIFDEESRPFQKAVYDLSQHNVRTLRQLLSGFSPENAEKLRDTYYRSAYGRGNVGPGRWRTRYQNALNLEGLSADLIAQIQLMQDDYGRQDLQIIEKIVATLESSRKYRTTVDLENEYETKAMVAVREFGTERSELSDRAIAGIDALLGPERTALLDDNKAKANRNGKKIVRGNGPAASQTVTAEVPIVHSSVALARDDLAIPEPMAMVEVREYASLMGIGDDNLVVVESMYADYLLAYQRTIEQLPTDEEGKPQADATTRKVAVVAADDALFNDLTLLSAESPNLARAQAMRHRAREHNLTKNCIRWGINQGAFVDIAEIVYDTPLIDEAPEACIAILDSYDRQSADVIEHVARVAYDLKRREELMGATKKRGGSLAETAEEKWMEAWRTFGEAQRGLAAMNHSTIDELTAIASTDTAWDLRYRFNREAYPDIYSESTSIENTISTALQLPDLSDSQRQRIVTIAGEFRNQFFEISDQMVQIRQANGDWWTRGAPARENIEREIDMERLRFERDEISSRARNKLRLSLTETQASQIM